MEVEVQAAAAEQVQLAVMAALESLAELVVMDWPVLLAELQ